MSGLFEHISAFDEQDRVATRKAVAVAHRRFDTKFSGFLNASSNLDEFNQRYALVEDEVKEMVEDVVTEYGGDSQQLEASLKEAAGGFCDDCKNWKSGPKSGCTCSDDDKDSDDKDSESKSSDEDDEHTSSVRQAITTQPIMTPVPLPDEPGKGVPDIDGELADAPSAVGHETISAVTPAMFRAHQLVAARQAAKPPTGDSAERRTKLPTGDESALGGPSPKINKGTWEGLEPIKTEGKGSPNPTVHQDIKDKPEYTGNFLDQTDAVTKHKQKLDKDTGNFTAPNTDTWSGKGNQASPVTQTALASTHTAIDDGTGQVGYPDQSMIDQHGGNQPFVYEDDVARCPHCGAGGGAYEDPEHGCYECGYKDAQAAPGLGHMPLASIDPDKNPIREILEASTDFVPQNEVTAAIQRFNDR